MKCGLCLPHCPTYALARTEAESPRGRIALMADMAENPGNYGAAALPSLDACLACRRCEAVCPAGVEVEALLLQSRAALPPALSWREKSVLWLLTHKPLLNAALGIYRPVHALLPAAWRPLPKPVPVAIPARPGAGTALFSGCVADTYEQGARAGLIRLLRAVGEDADVPEAQVCCGQAAAHAGRSAEAQTLAARNRQAFGAYRRLLVLASGCYGALQESAGIPVIDAGVYLAGKADALRFRSAGGRHVALHTPCSAAFHGSQAAMAMLLARIPDLRVSVLPDSGCCGAAGLHMLAQPERARTLRAPVLAAVPADADCLLSANIGCRLHLGKAGVTVRHPLEFMAEYLHAP